MNPLDKELKNALRHQEPSADFARRVMAGLQAAPELKQGWGKSIRNLLSFPALRWATTAVLFSALVIGGLAYHRHQQTVARGEMAREKVMLALHITSAKLNVAFREVRRTEKPAKVQDAPTSE
jgi:hypothetical protein